MLFNKGTKYLNANRPDKAIPCLKKALAENNFKEIWLNLGNAYRLANRLDDALHAYLQANSEDVPSSTGKYGMYSLALCNLGLLSYMQGKDDEAIAFYQACLDLDPNHNDAIWNCANAMLRKYFGGDTSIDLNAAWRMYSYRFVRNSPVKIDRDVPLWDGVSRVKRIVVLSEQGMGDKIMFGRYIHMLRDYCDSIVVQCPEELDCIFSDYEVCRAAILSGADAAIPICSLASRFGLAASPNWLPEFGKRELDGDFKIGIVATGSVTHSNNRNRSIPRGYFSTLNKYGTVYNLSTDRTAIRNVRNLNPKSWTETIENLKGLDLVISCDTSVVHMAGSLGIKTIMLQPILETDFRWGYGGTSMWYPSVEVLQNPGSWEEMFKVLDAYLAEMTHKRNYDKLLASFINPVMQHTGKSEAQVKEEMGID